MNLIKYLVFPLFSLFTIANAQAPTIISPQTVYTPPSEVELIEATFGSSSPIMKAVAQCESNTTQFNPDGSVLRGRIDKDDTGLYQINLRYHLETATKLGYDVMTTEGNIGYAKYLFDHYGLSPWRASRQCWDKL